MSTKWLKERKQVYWSQDVDSYFRICKQIRRSELANMNTEQLERLAKMVADRYPTQQKVLDEVRKDARNQVDNEQ